MKTIRQHTVWKLAKAFPTSSSSPIIRLHLEFEILNLLLIVLLAECVELHVQEDVARDMYENLRLRW